VKRTRNAVVSEDEVEFDLCVKDCVDNYPANVCDTLVECDIEAHEYCTEVCYVRVFKKKHRRKRSDESSRR